ncbi:ABC transporter ATP-binding protein/permease [Flavobacteriaceae bacterium]|mgnify:FL=1|nr:ABC transporter ATP-binding protein/permease [Flavobacteriaceae bacterium]
MVELKHLNKYLLKYKFKIITGIFITIIARIFALVAPNLIGNSITIIENYLFSNLYELDIVKEKLIINILMIIGSALLAGVFTFIMRQMLINVSRFIEFDLKNEIYNKYQTLSFDFYKNNRTGDLMNRISEDVSKVRMYIGPAIMYTINTIALFTIVITYMINVAPKLTMYTLIPLPVLSYIIYKISIVINFKSKIVQEYLSKLTTYTQESFSGVKIIKTYTIEKNINNGLAELASSSRSKNMSLVKTQAWFFPLMILLIGISNILVVFIGGNQYMNNEIELGVLAEFIIYVNMLTWPVATVGWVTSIVQQAEASQKRINQFLNTKSSIVNKSKIQKSLNGKIEYKKVDFTYPETEINASKNISFCVEKGESLAIMGNIGSGKSTILELLCRIYDPINGEILIDGFNLKEIGFNELRDSIGFVPQSTFLFSETIEKNIKFGKEKATKTDLENAAKNACIFDDIISFKDGFHTLLGERGVNLSGGQKQRIAIARAIIKEPKILILDDSLSAVDTETEEKILSNVSRISKNITLIIATHRISSAKKCDKILVLENGKVIEYGTHNKLVKNKGYYYDTVKKQSK